MKTRNELHWIEFEGGLWMMSDGKQLHCPVRLMQEAAIDPQSGRGRYFECEHDKSRWHFLSDAKANCETYMVG